jgi:hypothetical protein
MSKLFRKQWQSKFLGKNQIDNGLIGGVLAGPSLAVFLFDFFIDAVLAAL